MSIQHERLPATCRLTFAAISPTAIMTAFHLFLGNCVRLTAHERISVTANRQFYFRYSLVLVTVVCRWRHPVSRQVKADRRGNGRKPTRMARCASDRGARLLFVHDNTKANDSGTTQAFSVFEANAASARRGERGTSARRRQCATPSLFGQRRNRERKT